MADLQLTEKVDKMPRCFQLRQVSSGKYHTFMVSLPKDQKCIIKKSDIFNRVNDCANSSTGLSINYLFMCSSVVTYYGMIFYEVQVYATNTCMICIIYIKFYEIHTPKCRLMVLQSI